MTVGSVASTQAVVLGSSSTALAYHHCANQALKGLQGYKMKPITIDSWALVHTVIVVVVLAATVAGGGAVGHECR